MKRTSSILYMQYGGDVFPVDLEKHTPLMLIKHPLGKELEVHFAGGISHKEDKCTAAQMINLGLLGYENFMRPLTDKRGYKYWIDRGSGMRLLVPRCKYHAHVFEGLAVKTDGSEMTLWISQEELDRWKEESGDDLKGLDLTPRTDMVRVSDEKALPLSDVIAVTLASAVERKPDTSETAWRFDCVLTFASVDAVILLNKEEEIAELWKILYPELTMTYAGTNVWKYIRRSCINRTLLKYGAGTIAGGIDRMPLLDPGSGKPFPMSAFPIVHRNLPKEQILDAADKKLLVSKEMVFAEYDIKDKTAQRITKEWPLNYSGDIDASALIIAGKHFDQLKNIPEVVPLPMPYSRLLKIYGGNSLGTGISLQAERICWPVMLRRLRSGEYESCWELLFSTPAYPGKLYRAPVSSAALPGKVLLKLGGKKVPRLEEDPKLGLDGMLGFRKEFQAEDIAAIEFDDIDVKLYMQSSEKYRLGLGSNTGRVFACKLKDYIKQACGMFMVRNSQGRDIWVNCRHYSEARTKRLRSGSSDRSTVSFRGGWELAESVNSAELDNAVAEEKKRRRGLQAKE